MSEKQSIPESIDLGRVESLELAADILDERVANYSGSDLVRVAEFLAGDNL